jgi:WD40 repeat protein
MAFHPENGNLLATASEDQTVHIYENVLTKPNLIQVLKGHERAVTCLSWKKTVSDILVSCIYPRL